MGAVFVGEHVHMQKRVAIKVLRPEVEGFATMAARFEREAIAGARVDHPNVAAATDFGRTEDGSYFLVLEYVPGKTLRQVIKAGAVPPARAAHLARQIAAGLDACHRAGVLHRDVKPRNIIVDEARGDLVKLIDFGLARVPTVVEPDETDGEEAADGDEAPTHRHLTIKGIVFGTVAYMAPEAALGMEAVDERSDLYALGMILYEMLAGRHAFDATEPAELFLSQRVTIPPPLCERAPEVPVPPALEAVALRLLAKRPADRYPTAAAVVEALDAAACTDGVTAGATRSGSINLSVPPPRPRIDPGMPSETTPLEGSYSITAARLSSVPPEPDGASRPPGAPADAAPAAPASAGDDGDLRRAAARFRAGRRRALWIAGAVAAFAAGAAGAPAAPPRAAAPRGAPAPAAAGPGGAARAVGAGRCSRAPSGPWRRAGRRRRPPRAPRRAPGSRAPRRRRGRWARRCWRSRARRAAGSRRAAPRSRTASASSRRASATISRAASRRCSRSPTPIRPPSRRRASPPPPPRSPSAPSSIAIHAPTPSSRRSRRTSAPGASTCSTG